MGFKVASRVRGLSDEAFREAFGTKEQCRAALVRLRWPDGFVCPCCGHREHCVLAGRGLYQCNRCKKQTSPTAGTIFHATKLPLTLWFAAIHLVVTAKNGISSVELGRRLGVKQPTAWAVKHKIMAVMARREGETRLTGRVEMDDAYLGGVRSGGKRGRGAAGKTPFVAAVSTSPEGRPRKLKLAPVKGFRKREIARGAKHWLAPGAAVVTDGLGCWSALDEAACSHQAIRTGSGRQAARMASFKWVNTTLGNIKSAITGTYRKLGPDHAGRYLASFAWRYNRRYQLQTMIPRFVHSAARTQPLPYRLLIAGCLSGISRISIGRSDRQGLVREPGTGPPAKAPPALIFFSRQEPQQKVREIAGSKSTETETRRNLHIPVQERTTNVNRQEFASRCGCLLFYGGRGSG